MKQKLAPVHPLSAFLTIVIDLSWTLVEIPATVTVVGLIVTSLVCLAITFPVVMLVQRFVDNDAWGASFAKGLVMGITAGVPYPIVGTVAGTALLGWAGIKAVSRKLSSGPS